MIATSGRPARRRYISKVANSHSRFVDMFIVVGPARRKYISKVANSHSRFVDMFIVVGPARRRYIPTSAFFQQNEASVIFLSNDRVSKKSVRPM